MLLALTAGIKNENPVKNRKSDMSGKVVSSKFRRPKVSIV